MRLDKFLKVSRLIKRRTVANKVCTAGKILINEKIAKPSSEVKEKDILEIKMGLNPIKVRILKIYEFVRKEDTKDMYEII